MTRVIRAEARGMEIEISGDDMDESQSEILENLSRSAVAGNMNALAALERHCLHYGYQTKTTLKVQ